MDELVPIYMDNLNVELQQVSEGVNKTRLPIHTVYFGGGTPSLLEIDQVRLCLENIQRHYDLAVGAEITIEANPGTVTNEMLYELRELGINRLSLGVQSDNSRLLRQLARGHTFDQAQQAFELARKVGFRNINIDLIFGLPTQTLNDWEETLNIVLQWQPDHLALYSLMVESGTPLAGQIDRGELVHPDPDIMADMYAHAMESLQKPGYNHYEISNWAIPGAECLHNMQYWLGKPYLGFGAGAYGCADNFRYWNVAPIPSYIQRMKSQSNTDFPFSSALESYEELDAVARISEMILLGLRLPQRGVNREDFRCAFGIDMVDLFHDLLPELAATGFVEITDVAVKLASKSLFVSNQIVRRFMNALSNKEAFLKVAVDRQPNSIT